jgi:NAD(P)-dependent dehydrogenase (short-subunit alcohol dehydrogenase family)
MDNPSFSLAGRKALVTGASRGIGQALAVGLARAGADVAVAAREQPSLSATAAAIAAAGRQAVAIAMDVRVVGAIRAGVATAAEALGGLDILINNAGVEQVADSLAVDEALWDRILDTNLKGAFFCAQAAAQRMTAGRGGAIVNICSLTSEVGVPTATPMARRRADCSA